MILQTYPYIIQISSSRLRVLLRERSMRRTFVALIVASVVAAVPVDTFAQNYPGRPITLVIPFAPGGPSYAILRAMEPRIVAALGQPIIVENISGASGSLGTGKLAHAAPDGYTIGLGQWDNLVLNEAMFDLP